MSRAKDKQVYIQRSQIWLNRPIARCSDKVSAIFAKAAGSEICVKQFPCLVLLSQTESPRRTLVTRDSAHGRDSRQDQELSWKTRGAAAVAPDALRRILPIWRACWATLDGTRRW